MSGRREIHTVTIALRLAVGVIFVVAGVGKALNPAAFAAQIANYRLLSPWLVAFTAVALPWAEILAGALLLIGRAVRPAALVSLLLDVAFVGAVGTAVLRGLNIECGCFAGSHGLVGVGHLLEDLLLLGATIWVYIEG